MSKQSKETSGEIALWALVGMAILIVGMAIWNLFI